VGWDRAENLDVFLQLNLSFEIGHFGSPIRNRTVRFIVRDNLSGRVGTVSVPVDAVEQAAKSQ
jgi:hypothetical protein